MEKKKSNGNDVKAFIVVLILVVLAAVLGYIYLYMPMAEQRKTLEKENYDLDVRRINLLNLATDKEDEFKLGINEANKTIKQVMDHYSAGNTPEKSIMMVDYLEKEVGLRLPNLSFTQPTLLSTVQMPIVTETSKEAYTIEYYDVSLLKETLTTNYSCSYAQLKELINTINRYPERMNIDAITITFDSENNGLKGNLTLNLYAVTGTGKQYVAPEITGMSMGSDNIFGQ